MVVPGGEYALTIEGKADVSGDFAFRMDNLVGTGTPIDLSIPVESQHVPGNETDWYRFSAEAGDQLYFDLMPVGMHSNDTHIRLIGPSGEEVFVLGSLQDIESSPFSKR